MNKREIRTRLAHAAIIAGIDQKQTDEWYRWVMEDSDEKDLNEDDLLDIEEVEEKYAEEENLRKNMADEIASYTRLNFHDADGLLIYIHNHTLSLKHACNLARIFIKTTPNDIITNALGNGQIKGVVPDFKEIQGQRWDPIQRKYLPTGKTCKKTKGRYEFETKSLLNYLRENYTCLVPDHRLTELFDKILSD